MKRFTEVVLMLCIAMMCTTSFEAQGQSRRSGGGGSSHSSPRTEHRAPSGHSGPSTKMSAPRNNNHGSSVSRNSGSVSRSHSAPQVNRSSSSVSRSRAPQVNRNSGSVNRGGNISRSQSAPRVSRSQSAPQVNRNHSGNVARSNGPSVRSNSRPATRPNSGATVNRAPRGNSGSMTRTPRAGADRGSMTRAPRTGSDRGNVTRSPRPGSNHSAAIARNHGPVGGRGDMTRGPRPGHAPAAVHHNPRPVHRGPAYARPYLEPRHRPIPYHHYGYHYFGHRIHTLPIGYSLIRIGYRDYYYYDGIYYRPYWDGGYYICRPPLGTRIAATLFDVAMTTIAINTIRNEIERARAAAELSSYYAAQNANYVVRTSDDYYNANLVNQAGQNYYYQDGVFYTLKDGEYCVIEAPIGALVDEIPEDYDEIELGGKTYYQVEDTLFKPTIIDGKLRFEVACNL